MKNSILKSKLVILVIFWIIGCEDSGEVKEVYPISNVNFLYGKGLVQQIQQILFDF